MGRLGTSALVALAVGAEYVAAHGHLENIVVNGVFVQGYNPTSFPYAPNGGPITVGWPHVQPINEFVSPDNFSTPDIICHKDARPALGHYEVAAGTRIMFQWDQWPSAHQGPIIDALAPCDGPCESVDKTKLEFFKIAQTGLLDGSKNPGWWAADILLKNNLTWVAQIPENIAPGNYVWRHDMIALHAAGSVNGAQAYPMCVSLKITGSGTYKPKGSSVQTWYDTKMVYDLYRNPMLPYTIPGPDLDPLFSSSVSQGSTKATSTASITTAGADSAPAASNAPVEASAEPATSTQAAATTQPAVSVGLPATSATAHHVAATSSAAPSANVNVGGGGGGAVAGAALYGQCGGIGWNGPTTCAQGKCTVTNQYYSQCR